MIIKIFVDGKELNVTPQNDVKIVIEYDQNKQIHFNHTHEGIITDCTYNGDVFYTSSNTYDELLADD